jgi:HNH endonuclease
MATLHDEARKLLPIIVSAASSHKYLTYQTAAQKLGRPKNHARTVAQICDLLDAAAALADVPLLALITVLEADHRINRKAWTRKDVEPWIREAIIKRSQQHTFTQADFDAIDEALGKLEGKSNQAAWAYLETLMPSKERRLRLAGVGTAAYSDAIDDLGTDSPAYVPYTGKRYARDSKIRQAVKQRAAGKCEYCGEVGFECDNGTSYLECHHILALAKDGEDRMTNVIAICPRDHSEAHFGKRRAKIEVEMISKVKIVEEKRLGGVIAS